MIKDSSRNIKLYQFLQFQNVVSIAHGISTRVGGISEGNYASLNLSFNSGDKPANVIENRRLLAGKFSVDAEKLFFPDQCHTAFVREVSENTMSGELKETDALITNRKGILIGVLAADCVPILLFDPVQKAIAAIHAGWKGTAGRIVARCVEQMVIKFGSQPANILAGLGPAISQQYFEVGEEVNEKFSLLFDNDPAVLKPDRRSGKAHIDLWEANRELLLRSGLSANNIELSKLCTYSNGDEFFSARRDGFNTGRFAACIMLV